MKCLKCGMVVEEDSQFCAGCGAKIEEEEKKNVIVKKKDWVKNIGILVGMILIIIGFVRIFTAGSSISSTSFGGDFYTYTYQGIVAISEILASIEVTMGWIVVAIGTAIDVIAFKF